MQDTELLIPAAVKAILMAAAPAGVPADLPIRCTGDTEPETRPYLVAFCEDTEAPHPKLRKMTLVLRLVTRADEQEAATAGEWHISAAEWLAENPAALAATLEPYDLKLKFFRTDEFSDKETEGRARQLDQRWGLWVEES